MNSNKKSKKIINKKDLTYIMEGDFSKAYSTSDNKWLGIEICIGGMKET